MDTGERTGSTEPSDVEVARPGRDEGTDVPFGTLRPSERLALVFTAFGAMCVLLLPGELVAGGICGALALGLYFWHRVRSKRERAAAAAAAPPRGGAATE